jgi:hypothetical protein
MTEDKDTSFEVTSLVVFPTCVRRRWGSWGPRLGRRITRAGGDVQIATDGEIDLSDAVPGWVVAVADFFA